MEGGHPSPYVFIPQNAYPGSSYVSTVQTGVCVSARTSYYSPECLPREFVCQHRTDGSLSECSYFKLEGEIVATRMWNEEELRHPPISKTFACGGLRVYLIPPPPSRLRRPPISKTFALLQAIVSLHNIKENYSNVGLDGTM